jgi:hypothetical protein
MPGLVPADSKKLERKFTQISRKARQSKRPSNNLDGSIAAIRVLRGRSVRHQRSFACIPSYLREFAFRILCFNPRPAAAFVPTVQITQKGTQTPRLGPSSYRTSVGTTLMLLYGDPLISFVLTTV